MYKIALVVSCLACAGHGRRLQTATEQSQHHPNAEVDARGNRESLRSLGRLLASSPSAAFNPSSSGKSSAAGRPRPTGSRPMSVDRRSRLGHHFHTERQAGETVAKPSKENDDLTSQVLTGAIAAAIALSPAVASAGDIADSGLAIDHTSTLLAFADQAGNAAGPIFASSLFPYLAFLYFLRQDANGLSPVAKGGFTFLLAFVVGTIVTSIVAVKGYELTLANVDWLHGGAEQLLAFTNILNVIGLKLTLDGFMSGKVSQPAEKDQLESDGIGELGVVGITAAVAVAACAATYAAAGGDLAAHSAYLGGLGNLPDGLLPLSEPANALSLPTWVIHSSSLLEWLVAMGLVWRIGLASGNPRWKGMTWAMIPSHSSGICACVYHIFYNSQQWIVLAQSSLTLLGNICLAIAAYRLAASNGWEFSLPGSEPKQDAEPGESSAEPGESSAVLEAKVPVTMDKNLVGNLATVFAWSLIAAYLVKYGGAALPITTESPDWAALLLIVIPTAYNVFKWNERSGDGKDFVGLI